MLKAKSIGFCSISTGVYGFPIDRAVSIALNAVATHAHHFDRVVFAMFGAQEYEVFHNSLLSIRK